MKQFRLQLNTNNSIQLMQTFNFSKQVFYFQWDYEIYLDYNAYQFSTETIYIFEVSTYICYLSLYFVSQCPLNINFFVSH